MDEKTSGIILRTRPLTETSLIVNWLTPDFGRLATVAKGARRPKSPFRGKLDLFYLADFSFRRSHRSELHILREVSVRDPHLALREDIHLLQQAAYCAKLIEQVTEMDTPLPDIFRLLVGLLDFLPQHRPAAQTIFAFEIKLLAELGLKPEPDRAALTPGSRQVLQQLGAADWLLLATLRLSRAQTTELRQFLHGFLIYHLGRIPTGRTAALG